MKKLIIVDVPPGHGIEQVIITTTDGMGQWRTVAPIEITPPTEEEIEQNTEGAKESWKAGAKWTLKRFGL